MKKLFITLAVLASIAIQSFADDTQFVTSVPEKYRDLAVVSSKDFANIPFGTVVVVRGYYSGVDNNAATDNQDMIFLPIFLNADKDIQKAADPIGFNFCVATPKNTNGTSILARFHEGDLVTVWGFYANVLSVSDAQGSNFDVPFIRAAFVMLGQ